jgi:uroporphyrinogen-III decarboxylase
VGNQEAQVFTHDPTAWANLLVKTVELLDLDGVVAGLDFTVLAEACGCTVDWQEDLPRLAGPAPALSQTPEDCGRLKVALEEARPVCETSRAYRAYRACVAAMTGPVALASQVRCPSPCRARAWPWPG